MGTPSPLSFAGIDFESARLKNSRGDEPVQIGIAVFSPSSSASPSLEICWKSYLKPSGAVFSGPGLSDASVLDDAPDFLSLWPKIRQSLHGRILVAHGAGTEKRFLRAFPGHGFGPWIDTLRLSRAVLPSTPSHSLGDLCSTLDIEPHLRQLLPDTTWHDALFDAIAALLLLRKLTEISGANLSDIATLSRPAIEKYFRSRRISASANRTC